MSFGLVRHSHPLHGELATLNEISTHLIEKEKAQCPVKQNVGEFKIKKRKGKAAMKIKTYQMKNTRMIEANLLKLIFSAGFMLQHRLFSKHLQTEKLWPV